MWIMEASLDASVFKLAKKGSEGSFLISELELENKYRPREVGTRLLDEVEKLLAQAYPVKPGLASKFLQAVKHFDGEKAAP